MVLFNFMKNLESQFLFTFLKEYEFVILSCVIQILFFLSYVFSNDIAFNKVLFFLIQNVRTCS